MGTDPNQLPTKRWQLSLFHLFVAVTLLATGLALDTAFVRFVDSISPSLDGLVLFGPVSLGIALIGGGIGALVGTQRAIIIGLVWGYLLPVMMLLLWMQVPGD